MQVEVETETATATSFSLNQTRRLLVSVCSNQDIPSALTLPGGETGLVRSVRWQGSRPGCCLNTRTTTPPSHEARCCQWPLCCSTFAALKRSVYALPRRDITSPAPDVCSHSTPSPTVSQQRPPFSCLLAFPRETFQTGRHPRTDGRRASATVIPYPPSPPSSPSIVCRTVQPARVLGALFCVVMRTREEED
ncbi:hypothetical protein CGRA01v4_10199 [Colletotrichum graminicola]|nr:hypothetical protein CGRA01v4_10199 [Colletotrichum graminicola]